MSGDAAVRNKLVVGILLTSACIVGLLLARRMWVDASAVHTAAVPRDTARTRNEVVFVFIGDIKCQICRSDEFTSTLDRLILGLRGEVAARGDLFRAVGVVITPDIRGGYAYLRKHGRWDEISLGGGWLNTLAVQNVWRGESRGAVPQVVVFAHSIHRGPGLFLVSERTRSVTVTGLHALRGIADGHQWARLLPPPAHR